MSTQGWIILAVLAVIVIWTIMTYNGLVTGRNRFKNAFAQIDVQLKRRYDLIPNLVETAKGYIKHERETLEAVTRARLPVCSGGCSRCSSPRTARWRNSSPLPKLPVEERLRKQRALLRRMCSPSGPLSAWR